MQGIVTSIKLCRVLIKLGMIRDISIDYSALRIVFAMCIIQPCLRNFCDSIEKTKNKMLFIGVRTKKKLYIRVWTKEKW